MTYITLLSDFGDRDGYTGAMKGVILGLAPAVRVIDIAHGLTPGDVRAAAFVWESVLAAFPPGGVHVGVVDPGVGTPRQAVAARIGESQYVAPDNGLLTGLLDAGASQAVRIEGSQVRRPGPGATFDGRDVFAPAAAHLALGLPMSRLGAPIEPESLVRLPDLRARRADGRIVGSVVVVDRFGNLRTNIPQDWLPTEPITRLLSPDGAERTSLTGLRRAYGEARAGELLAYVGSAGTLEIGVRDGSAAEQLHLESGAGVVVEPW